MQPSGVLGTSRRYEELDTTVKPADAEFRAWATENRPKLLRTATLLAAGDPHLAEDVVQTTLTKVYLTWERFRRTENRSAYARRMLVNVFADEMRSTRRKAEDSRADLPEHPVPARDDDAVALLYAALRELPVGMRSIIVLRYFHDLTVEETARALRCRQGTVKSQTARGLAKLRANLGPLLREAAEDDDPAGRHASRLPIESSAPADAAPAVPLSTVVFSRSFA